MAETLFVGEREQTSIRYIAVHSVTTSNSTVLCRRLWNNSGFKKGKYVLDGGAVV